MKTRPAEVTRHAVKLSHSDRIYYLIVNIICTLILLIVLDPLVFVISSSFSDPNRIAGHGVLLWPVGFSTEGYKAVFEYSDVLVGYKNTIIYTVLGTVINVAMTMICAYPLARKTLPFRNAFMFFFSLVMFIDGGLIPNYILIQKLGIMNTIWTMLLPGAISVYNMIITRTFIQTNIPEEMLEATQVDGCSDARFFFSFVLPLSKAILAVISLYYAVRHWNEWFNAFIYLDDRSKYPLQLFLREILIANANSTMAEANSVDGMQFLDELIKYCSIIVSTVPILIAYPFVQKYFVTGVMIGSVKE